MRFNTDRPHAGSAAAMRDAEGLVEIEVADISAHIAGPGKADKGIHVGAVEVNLAAILVRDLADFANRLLEHAMGGG